MLSNLAHTFGKAVAVLATACGILFAMAAPAGAFSTTPDSWGGGTRTPDRPNKCYSAQYFSGQFTPAGVSVGRALSYPNSTQQVAAWITLFRYDTAARAWRTVMIDNQPYVFTGWYTMNPYQSSARLSPQTIYNLSPGWYSVKYQYAWWVSGVGYVGNVTDFFNNDVYDRNIAASGGDVLNVTPSVLTTVGMCYVD
jgi:hypothetical protein